MRKNPSGMHPEIKDYGGKPFIFNIHHATTMNENFRTTIWTGQHLQLTLMSIPIGGEIGEERHDDVDQFIRIESGRAAVYIGEGTGATYVNRESAILIPAGTLHNVVNIGYCPLKLYSLYAPPKHRFGTVHKTKEEAAHAEP